MSAPTASSTALPPTKNIVTACIIVDFGTATTIDLISKKGEYIGGAIAPGLSISLEALVQRASKLPRIEIVKPKEVVGRNTVNSIQAGIFFGYVGLVDGIVRRIQKEQNVRVKGRRHRRLGAVGGVGVREHRRGGRIFNP